eukprot:COSAG02_NODE_1542_length_12011_cov_103.068754_3_plen_69_part_00
MLATVRQNGDALQYASTALKANKEVVLEAVRQYRWALQYASEALKKDKDSQRVSIAQQAGGDMTESPL